MELIPTIKAKRSEVRHLYDDVIGKQLEAVKDNRLLKGRQIVFMILDYYKCNANLELMYTVEHLSSLTFDGDPNLHTFKHTWEYIIREMKDKFGDNTLRDMLERKLRTSLELSGDLQHFDRSPEGHVDHTYKFLLQSIHRALHRQRMS